MNIVYKKLDEIMPYERNPRHNEESVSLVANSIKEFGFKQPIVIDAAGVIVCGHTRYLAARELGLKSVPTVVADDLSPYQISAYRLADNKTAEHSNWDYSLLNLEMGELESHFDMGEFGFDDLDGDEDMDKLLDSLFESEEERVEKDIFKLTITFPKREEEMIKDYIDKNGREEIAKLILKEARK